MIPITKNERESNRTYLYYDNCDNRFCAFRSENLSQAAMMITKMFTISPVTLESTLLLRQLLSHYTIFILFICVVACLGIVPKIISKRNCNKSVVECGSYVFAMILFGIECNRFVCIYI